MNKNGKIRNLLRRRYNYTKRLFQNLAKLRKDRFETIDIEFYKKEIDSICNEIQNYKENYKIEDLAREKIGNYTSLSFNGDWMGKVLRYNDKIYRGIYENSVEAFWSLWKTGIIQVLSKRGYIAETNITNLYDKVFPIILEHKKLNISTSKSWSYYMIRDATVSLCIIRNVLMRFGYTLHDAHLNNLTFSDGRFVFTDIGSIKKADFREWDGFPKELVFAALYKLVFFMISNSIIKRNQIFDEYNNSIWFKERVYDDSTIEYYKTLKAYKWRLFITGRWKILLNVFKLFDLYLIDIDNIIKAFPDRKLISDIDLGVNLKILKDFIMLIQNEIKTICVFDTISEHISFNLSEFNKTITIITDYDKEADMFYKEIKNSHLCMNISLKNIMYGSDDVTDKYCISDLLILTNIINKTNSFHQHSYDSCLYAAKKMTKKFAIISYSDGDNLNYHIDSYDNIFFEEIKRIKDGKIIYLLLEKK